MPDHACCECLLCTAAPRPNISQLPDTPAPPAHLQNGPSISLYLTFFGILLGFLSIFWSFGARCARGLAVYA